MMDSIYLTLVISPKAHLRGRVLFNIGCIGRHVTSSLSAHVTKTSDTFYFKMADASAVFCFQLKGYENQASPHLGMQENESTMHVRYG